MASAPDEHAVGHRHARAEQPELIRNQIHGGNTFMKTRRARAHPPVFDQGGEKPFAVIRTADRTAQQHAGAIPAVFKIEPGARDGFAGGQPAEAVAARTASRRAEGGEIVTGFRRREPGRNGGIQTSSRGLRPLAPARTACQMFPTPQPGAATMPRPVTTGKRAATRRIAGLQ